MQRKGDFLPMKKVLLVLLAIAVCIPAVVAIISYQTTKKAPPDASTVTTMTLTDPNGVSYVLTDEKGENSDDVKTIKMITGLMESGTKVSGLPLQFDGSHYSVVMSNRPNTTYKFYFTTNPEVCYYADDAGVYKLDAAAASKFLATSYAACLYTASEMPVLTLSGKAATATEAAWFYKSYDGSYITLDVAPYLSQAGHYDLEGGLDMAFDADPDTCTVTVTSQSTGNVIFNDSMDKLSTIDLSAGGTISVVVNAVWTQSDEKSSYGNVTYAFTADVTAPAQFFLMVSEKDPKDKNSKGNQAGDLMAITAYNVSDPSKILFSSDPDLGFTPVFYAVSGQDYAVALVPLPVSLKKGTIKLTLTYGGLSTEIPVAVEARSVKSSNLVVSNAIYNTYYTDSAISAYNEEIAPYLTYASPTQYWAGDFKRPVNDPKDEAIKAGFAYTRNIYIAKKSAGKSFQQETIVYKANKGAAVNATAAGEVIYAGYLDHCGNIVILEHGYGLKSWYLHMDSVTVRVGQAVAAGEQVGTAGSTGFFTTDYTGVEFGMSVFGQFFCPYDLWSDGELAGIVFATKPQS